MAATEYTITVPIELVKRTTGLALDIGGSVVKIVYRSKENLKEAESNTNGTEGHLQLASFPKGKLTEALEYIQQQATITRNGTGEQPEILATGFGFAKLATTVSEILNMRLNIVVEFDCFVKAFTYLASRLSTTEFLEARDLKAAREAEEEMMHELAAYTKIQEIGQTECFNGMNFNLNYCQQLTKDENYPLGSPLDKCEDIYPCILAMCGSGIVFLQINADKTYKVLDLSYRGGKAFHGLGSLLTGYQDFEEFLELASRGDPSKVDIYSKDLGMENGVANGDENLYTIAADIKHSALVYSFGHAAGAKREEFRPEDLAIAWLNYFALDIVQCLTLIAQIHGIKRLFFCGSVCNNRLVRRILTKEMTRRIIFLNFFASEKVGGTRFNFLKSGPHLGALGAYITEFEKLTCTTNF